MTKTFYIFHFFSGYGIIVISFKGEDIGNMLPICISDGFLYMCSEPFVMVLNVVADLFVYCYERDFMDSLNDDNQTDVIEALNSTSGYLDYLLNIDNPYFEGMVTQIHSPE